MSHYHAYLVDSSWNEVYISRDSFKKYISDKYNISFLNKNSHT